MGLFSALTIPCGTNKATNQSKHNLCLLAVATAGQAANTIQKPKHKAVPLTLALSPGGAGPRVLASLIWHI